MRYKYLLMAFNLDGNLRAGSGRHHLRFPSTCSSSGVWWKRLYAPDSEDSRSRVGFVVSSPKVRSGIAFRTLARTAILRARGRVP